MLSLSKKSDEQSDVEPRWHPDFRNVERLPDTKVVRTTFFINTAAIATTLALLMWLGYREFHIRTLEQQITDAEHQIDANSRQNKEALRLSQIFIDEETKLDAAVNFVSSPISITEFIEVLGRTLPAEISIESIDARLSDSKNRSYVLRGLVAGTRDQASGSASTYVDTLRANPRLKKVFDAITLERIAPDGATGLLSFEISLKEKPEAKK